MIVAITDYTSTVLWKFLNVFCICYMNKLWDCESKRYQCILYADFE